MNPLDMLRREIVGACRSVRYDLGRRAEARDGADGDSWYSQPLTGRDVSALRDPRRVGAAIGVASIIVASAAGTYFAVAGGLGLLLADTAGVPVPPQAAPFAPLAPAPQPAQPKAGRHHHGAPAHRSTAARPVAAGPVAAAEVVGRVRPLPADTTTVVPPRSPVPESTGTVTPSPTASPSPSPSVSDSNDRWQPRHGH